MRRSIACMIMVGVFLTTMCACAGEWKNALGSAGDEPATDAVNTIDTETENVIDEEPVVIVNNPNISRIRSICELATLKCYYHNVAKSVKEKGTGISHIGEKERTFWIEYTGSAKFGINASKVTMEIEGNQITITIPKAEMLGLAEYEFSDDSYISSDDGLNKNPITADDQTEAIRLAEEDMKQLFANDETMLMRAQDNAKRLIENYIQQLGELSETEYQIVWVYEDNLPTEDGQEKNQQEE